MGLRVLLNQIHLQHRHDPTDYSVLLESIVKSDSSPTIEDLEMRLYMLESIVKSDSSPTPSLPQLPNRKLESIVKSDSSPT